MSPSATYRWAEGGSRSEGILAERFRIVSMHAPLTIGTDGVGK